jgi:lipoic acid synthetase
MGDCWARRTATFMILGNSCSRFCSFCAVDHGSPGSVDPGEPDRIGRAVADLKLRHAVITSVTRDDLPDGGSGHFAETIGAIRRIHPNCLVEVLVPDFKGDERALITVLEAGPDILNHNIETVPRLYPQVRPGADYQDSLNLLRRAASRGAVTKSGLMLGLGESVAEVRSCLRDLRRLGCQMVTLGQYLQPTRAQRPVVRFVPPEEFTELAREGHRMGFRNVLAGPLVRSSYFAEDQFARSPENG